MNLTWRRTFEEQGPHGEQCVREDCREHPRVYVLRQRPNVDTDWIETFHVERIPVQHWHTAAEAVAAMRANPE